jgi:hypothetical protein
MSDIDALLIDAGSMIGIQALSEEATHWLDENVEVGGYQHLGSVLYLDNRDAVRIVDGMHDYGLIIGC